MVHAFDPSTWEAKVGEFLSSRPARATQRNPVTKKKKKKKKKKEKKRKEKKKKKKKSVKTSWNQKVCELEFMILNIWNPYSNFFGVEGWHQDTNY